jgi:hypothetical protein
VTGELVELRAEIEPGAAKEIVFTIRGARIAYDVERQELVIAGLRAPAPLINGRLRLSVFCDRTGIEVFAADGLCYVPLPFQPRPARRAVSRPAGAVPGWLSLPVTESR